MMSRHPPHGSCGGTDAPELLPEPTGSLRRIARHASQGSLFGLYVRRICSQANGLGALAPLAMALSRHLTTRLANVACAPVGVWSC